MRLPQTQIVDGQIVAPTTTSSAPSSINSAEALLSVESASQFSVISQQSLIISADSQRTALIPSTQVTPVSGTSPTTVGTAPSTVEVTTTAIQTISSTKTSGSTQQAESQSGLSTSAKIGIGVGVPVSVLLLVGICLVLWRRRRTERVELVNQPTELEGKKKPESSVHEIQGGAIQPYRR